jgi:ribonuclease P protein component
MLKKANRIPRGQFDLVFKTGKRLHSPLLQLIYIPGEMAFSVVVSKKVAKQAVMRNRLRRRLYGVVERFFNVTNSPVLFQGIFILKPGAAKATRASLATEAADLLAQIQKSR